MFCCHVVVTWCVNEVVLFDESTFSDEEAEFDWKAYLLEEEDLYTVHYADTPVNMYSLTLKALKYFYIKQESKVIFSIWNHHKCLS